MLGLQDHPDPLGAQAGVQAVGDLPGHPFLDLQAPGERLDDPGKLGQAHQALSREVPDMRHAVEGQQVVLAQRPERDVPHQD
jgi:hypothetical protein